MTYQPVSDGDFLLRLKFHRNQSASWVSQPRHPHTKETALGDVGNWFLDCNKELRSQSQDLPGRGDGEGLVLSQNGQVRMGPLWPVAFYGPQRQLGIHSSKTRTRCRTRVPWGQRCWGNEHLWFFLLTTRPCSPSETKICSLSYMPIVCCERKCLEISCVFSHRLTERATVLWDRLECCGFSG